MCHLPGLSCHTTLSWSTGIPAAAKACTFLTQTQYTCLCERAQVMWMQCWLVMGLWHRAQAEILMQLARAALQRTYLGCQRRPGCGCRGARRHRTRTHQVSENAGPQGWQLAHVLHVFDVKVSTMQVSFPASKHCCHEPTATLPPPLNLVFCLLQMTQAMDLSC